MSKELRIPGEITEAENLLAERVAKLADLLGLTPEEYRLTLKHPHSVQIVDFAIKKNVSWAVAQYLTGDGEIFEEPEHKVSIPSGQVRIEPDEPMSFGEISEFLRRMREEA